MEDLEAFSRWRGLESARVSAGSPRDLPHAAPSPWPGRIARRGELNRLMDKAGATPSRIESFVRNESPQATSGRVLILGRKRSSRRLAHCLSRQPWSDIPVVGFVDAKPAGPEGALPHRDRQLPIHPQSNPVPILGGVDRLAELVARSGATDVLIDVSKPGFTLTREVQGLEGSSVRVHWIADQAHDLTSTRHKPPTTSSELPFSIAASRLAKRALDFTVALLALIALAPLFAVVSILILCISGRPIFYRQDRIGQGGRIFQIWKFRSMNNNAESESGPIWASDHDARCTPIGDWLRHTNIDELPQLYNVLMGDMSLVGPRPERPIFVEGFREAIPDYDFRHSVPAGMTGWAQVHGWRGRTSLRKRIQYDLDYIRRWSFRLDLWIILMTFQHVFQGKTSWGGGGLRRKPDPE